MSTGFPELVVGGVLMAPFVAYAVGAAAVMAALRPLLRVAGFERIFSNPPLALLGIYVMILAALIVLF